jgi:hypothetical protein|tara:strand:+ start:2142 stop:2375 length:234 start_codon:yes stop_codon:yes gene_type:complete
VDTLSFLSKKETTLALSLSSALKIRRKRLKTSEKRALLQTLNLRERSRVMMERENEREENNFEKILTFVSFSTFSVF